MPYKKFDIIRIPYGKSSITAEVCECTKNKDGIIVIHCTSNYGVHEVTIDEVITS